MSEWVFGGMQWLTLVMMVCVLCFTENKNGKLRLLYEAAPSTYPSPLPIT